MPLQAHPNYLFFRTYASALIQHIARGFSPAPGFCCYVEEGFTTLRKSYSYVFARRSAQKHKRKSSLLPYIVSVSNDRQNTIN